MKKFTTFAALSVLLSTTPALADPSIVTTKVEYLPQDNGNYETINSRQIVDSSGTTLIRNDDKIENDGLGVRETKIKTESSTDQRGLYKGSTTEVETRTIDYAVPARGSQGNVPVMQQY